MAKGQQSVLLQSSQNGLSKKETLQENLNEVKEGEVYTSTELVFQALGTASAEALRWKHNWHRRHVEAGGRME